jgi:hypothetical protein
MFCLLVPGKQLLLQHHALLLSMQQVDTELILQSVMADAALCCAVARAPVGTLQPWQDQHSCCWR